MSNFIILTDSSCDLPASMAEQMQIEVLPLTLDLEGDCYKNYLDGREIAFDTFYEGMFQKARLLDIIKNFIKYEKVLVIIMPKT